MKNLQDYVNDKQTKLLEETGTFFAFSKKQFEQQKVKGVKYSSLSGGFIVPTENSEKLVNGLKSIYEEGIKQDILENGMDKIIIRELYNHESFYDGDISRTIEYLKSYNVNPEDVKRLFDVERKKDIDF